MRLLEQMPIELEERIILYLSINNIHNLGKIM
jgi:hypothetical protein